jgi:hypothetical protein
MPPLPGMSLKPAPAANATRPANATAAAANRTAEANASAAVLPVWNGQPIKLPAIGDLSLLNVTSAAGGRGGAFGASLGWAAAAAAAAALLM